MRLRPAAILMLLGPLALSAEAGGQVFTPAKAGPQRPAGAARPPARPAPGSPTAVYAAMPMADRIAIQSDLIWTGDYNGMANGDFGESSVAAVKTFQRNHAGKDTGILNPDERQKLAQEAEAMQQRVGWKLVDDRATGAQFGLPTKLVPQQQPAATGTRWQTKRGEIQVESFRLAGPSVTLARAFDQQKKEPPQRKVEYSVLRGDFFVVSGMQGLKKFYVRAHEKGHEVRGVVVLYDQAMEGIMDPVVVAMSNSLDPFPASLIGGGAPKSKVEYATGVVVSAAGDILTDARSAAECQYVLVSGHDRAEKIAEQNGIALLRVYSPRSLAPLPLAAETAPHGEVALAGVADPTAQGGGHAASVLKAEVTASAGALSITPAPGPGFAGAAALDGQGRLLGLITPRPSLLAGPTPTGSGAALVPLSAVKALLEAQRVVPAPAANPGIEAAKASIVRVVCVRD